MVNPVCTRFGSISGAGGTGAKAGAAPANASAATPSIVRTVFTRTPLLTGAHRGKLSAALFLAPRRPDHLRRRHSISDTTPPTSRIIALEAMLGSISGTADANAGTASNTPVTVNASISKDRFIWLPLHRYACAILAPQTAPLGRSPQLFKIQVHLDRTPTVGRFRPRCELSANPTPMSRNGSRPSSR